MKADGLPSLHIYLYARRSVGVDFRAEFILIFRVSHHKADVGGSFLVYLHRVVLYGSAELQSVATAVGDGVGPPEIGQVGEYRIIPYFQ